MNVDWEDLIRRILGTLIFGGIGLGFFGLAFFLIQRICPFSIRKELEEDQNIALAVVMGSVILGIAIIVAAAVH